MNTCSFVRSNPAWREHIDADVPFALLPGDAPRSDLQLPLRCYNCDFVVNSCKYQTLENQRWRLTGHEVGKSGHGWGPCSYRCACGKWFTNSIDLRHHCRSEGHGLPKRYCTKVGVTAMATLPTGLGRASNFPMPDGKRQLDEILTQQIESANDEEGIAHRQCYSPPKRDGRMACRTPNVSPRSISSSGSRLARGVAQHYNALEGLSTDSVVNTGYVKVYQRYRRSRSPPRFVMPAGAPVVTRPDSSSQVTPKAPPAPVPQRTTFGQAP